MRLPRLIKSVYFIFPSMMLNSSALCNCLILHDNIWTSEWVNMCSLSSSQGIHCNLELVLDNYIMMEEKYFQFSVHILNMLSVSS